MKINKNTKIEEVIKVVVATGKESIILETGLEIFIKTNDQELQGTITELNDTSMQVECTNDDIDFMYNEDVNFEDVKEIIVLDSIKTI